MPLIKFESVTKTYFIEDQRIDAVKDLSLDIERGEFVSIVGHSGSGKTTLLSMLGGIARPTSGAIMHDDVDICSFTADRLSEHRCKKIGFMFQFSSLLQMLTIKENILVPLLFKDGAVTADDTDRAVDLLKRVGLADKLKAFPSQLSGGQQRRVAIARAFINNPEIILADEPTGDLDEETEAEMMELFNSMNKEENMTFVMVTHNIDLANRAGRRFRMTNGIIKEL
ncbi:MAG: ABC transporter ATP-binding protein [Nitrospirae bacterium]|nr:MAG: ABC transporter ATP-binding protein [Nitrospirota bacterium]